MFRQLAQTGCVEFIAETYYHSLSFLYSRGEFAEQLSRERTRLVQRSRLRHDALVLQPRRFWPSPVLGEIYQVLPDALAGDPLTHLCLTNNALADALGVDYVASCELGKLGEIYVLSLALLDVHKAVAAARRAAEREGALVRAVVRGDAHDGVG